MDPIDRSDISNLINLAKGQSEQARRKLIENIADLFLSREGRLTEHQHALMSDILCKLIAEAETSVRKELAVHLAAAGSAPSELTQLLANDQIEIARPILEQCNILQNEDLIAIVRQRSDEHRLCIAMRAKVSADVSDALLESGDEDVIEALLNNADAEISRQAMEYLVEESRRVDRFQEPLLRRHDLPIDLAHRMFWWVSAALRRRIVADFVIDETELDEAVEQATRKVLEGAPNESAMLRAQRLVARMAMLGNLNIRFLTDALKQEKISIFIAGLSEMSKVDTQTVWRVFNDQGGESLAILCKAIGMDRSDFTLLFLFLSGVRDGRKIRPANALKGMLAFYDGLELRNARAVVKFWQRDKSYLQAIKEVSHAAG